MMRHLVICLLLVTSIFAKGENMNMYEIEVEDIDGKKYHSQNIKTRCCL